MCKYIIDLDTYIDITGYDPDYYSMLTPEEMGLIPYEEHDGYIIVNGIKYIKNVDTKDYI